MRSERVRVQIPRKAHVGTKDARGPLGVSLAARKEARSGLESLKSQYSAFLTCF